MIKTKAINPYLVASISAFSSLIPILTFLLFPKNWTERLKWVCFFLIVLNFSFDQVSGYLSNKPIASGQILRSFSDTKHIQAHLLVTKGQIHEGVLLRSDNFIGTIIKIKNQDEKGNKWVEIEGEVSSVSKYPVSTFTVYSTLKIVNISLIIELILVFLIFFYIFKNVSPWNKIVVGAIILSIVVWIYRNIILDGLYLYGGFYNGGTTLLIILFSLVFFYRQLININGSLIYSTFIFWIVSAILIYRAGTFFLFLYSNSLDQTEKTNFFLINSAFYVIQNILFAVAFLINNKLSRN